MSNTNVGIVYQQVIKDVIESSRVDFEEGGVDESVLEALSQGWQKRLSAINIAQFPWDPKPEPVASAASSMQQQPQPAMIPQYDMNLPPSNIALPNMTMPQATGPRIKTEPGLEGNGLVAPPSFPQPAIRPPVGASAAQMAAINLQQQFGARASQSIDALGGMPSLPQQQPQAQNAIQNQQPRTQMPQYNQMGQPQQQNGQQTVSQYNASMKAATAQQAQRFQQTAPPPDIKYAQNDGAVEPSSGILNNVDASGNLIEMGRVEIDNLIRARIEANGLAMEGGGLMLPLKRHNPPTTTIPRKRPSGGDAAADDDDDVKSDPEEDAINSDLDDSEDDNLNEEDEEEQEAGGLPFNNLMLCMYDKVNRVKNKWKCVMKDGVICIDGKEYVFHKATGEYEW